MGDHLALLVDRLLTESTLEATIESRKRVQIGPSAKRELEPPTLTNLSSPGKMVECRICHDEDFDNNMEIPCSCCGSLKFAHRTCVQRWCNEKGDTTCEICLQQFKPNYTAPQQLFHYGSIPMNFRYLFSVFACVSDSAVSVSDSDFRGSWEISRRDVHDSQVITMVPSELGRVISDYDGDDGDGDGDDGYSYLRTRSTACCRSVAVIFMVLLVLRHSLPFVITGAEQYSFALFSLLVLRMAGVLFPVFVMVRALATFHRRRRQQEDREVHNSSSETEPENIRFNSSQLMHSQPHLVRAH